MEIDDEALSPSRLAQTKLDQSEQDGRKPKHASFRSSSDEDEDSHDGPSDEDGGVPERCRSTENRSMEYQSTFENILFPFQSLSLEECESEGAFVQHHFLSCIPCFWPCATRPRDFRLGFQIIICFFPTEYESEGNYVVVDSEEEINGTVTENKLDRKRSIFEIFDGQDNATALDVEVR